ncbi:MULTISPECIES: ABC-three component system middle component 1 [Pseudescherichia]|uniref:ABC-three component system middle component 1 n=1 Tax=Pseudescherichia TaxID=2055880 RepID=UPI001EDE4BDE|nr:MULTISPECIES: ABC-three component system middle component 1 [Pseudescherichia]
MMKTLEMEAQIRERAQSRFRVFLDKSLTILAEQPLSDITALKVQRSIKPSSSSRTILLAAIDKIEDWKIVVRWTAQVRDMLPEPETSDLYLILLAQGFSAHNRSRIEADEQFCRKYVTSSLDEMPQLLDRTFLASLSASDIGTKIVDPVTAAFIATKTNHSWLTNSLQDRWLKTFLSEKAGKDLVPDIIDNVDPEIDS